VAETPHVGEAANTEAKTPHANTKADTPHADVDADLPPATDDADIVSGPLSRMDLPVKMTPRIISPTKPRGPTSPLTRSLRRA